MTDLYWTEEMTTLTRYLEYVHMIMRYIRVKSPTYGMYEYRTKYLVGTNTKGK